MSLLTLDKFLCVTKHFSGIEKQVKDIQTYFGVKSASQHFKFLK